MHTVFVKLLSGDILPVSVEEASIELVQDSLADHLGCHVAQVALFSLEEAEEESKEEAEEAEETEETGGIGVKRSEKGLHRMSQMGHLAPALLRSAGGPPETEETEETGGIGGGLRPPEAEETGGNVPFIDGSCYGVVVHSILPLHLSLHSEGTHYTMSSYHVLRKFTLSFFTPMPYRLLHEITFYCDEYYDDTSNHDRRRFYPDAHIRSHAMMSYVVIEEEGKDSLYGVIAESPFLQKDNVDTEQVLKDAKRLFEKYMADLDAFEDELLSDEVL